MKNGVIVCKATSNGKNIGDYVQSVAARQFAGADAEAIERETMDAYDGDTVKVVMNAWFMHHPERFPPSDHVQTLFASFHLRPEIFDAFFTPETIAYLKRHAPIGCRDRTTEAEMARRGIPAYFSSCVTLTLGETFARGEVSGPPVFVDPYFKRLPRKWSWTFLWRFVPVAPVLVRHLPTALRLMLKFRVFRYLTHNSRLPVRAYYTGVFLRAYLPVFSVRVLAEAEYVTHKVLVNGADDTEMERRAADLLRRYAHAPFVVTSRLHCALPCLGMGVPVVVPYPERTAKGRFDGNIELLNRMDWNGFWRLARPTWLKTKDGRIHSAADIPVRNEWRAYAERLVACCRDFFRSEDNPNEAGGAR